MDTHIAVARALANLLDDKFGIGPLKIGLDPILGLIPGVGDAIPAILSLYIVWIGIQLKMPQEKIAKMIGNIVTDFVIGIIPIVGDIGDFIFKANSKNMALLEEHLAAVVEGEVVS